MNHEHRDHGGHALVSADAAKDPVCGMAVDPATAKWFHDHDRSRYYFCCDGCQAMFRSDPGKYLGKAPPVIAAAPVAAPGAGGQYTCPMHPEIVQDDPGSCPKCGMALVPMAGAVEDDSELRDMTRRFVVGAILSSPLVVIAMAPHFGWMAPFGLPASIRPYVELALGTPVVLWCAAPFFRKFRLSLTHRNPNMYTLIGLGVALAYAFVAPAAHELLA